MPEMKNATYYESDICCLKLVEEEGVLIEVSFCSRKEIEEKRLKSKLEDRNLEVSFVQTSFLTEVCRQLDEYFSGKRKDFALPLDARGTEFRKKVWEQLTHIPYGETISYGTLAQRIGNPKASRAVGMANHHNPIAVIIPCHRVVGADGRLVGFGGGLDVKQKLLSLETAVLSAEQRKHGGRVDEPETETR